MNGKEKEPTVEHGKRLKWENIKIGQAFYFKGCQGFGLKTSSQYWAIIDCADVSEEGYFASLRGNLWKDPRWGYGMYMFYAIPKSLRKALEPIK